MSLVPLTPAQRRKLQRLLKEVKDASYYRRLLAILEMDRGLSVAEVAQVLGVTRQSVYNWAKSFGASSDPEDLEDHYGVGRPSAWTEELVTLLRTSLGQRPEELGYLGTTWTVPLLREHLYRCGGTRLSEDTIRRQLDELGYVWKRFRYVLPPDPEREKKTRNSAAFAGLAARQRQAG